jgi:hypothetical protein
MPTDNCGSPQHASLFCEEIAYKPGQVLCGTTADEYTPIAANVSCIAQQSGLWLSVNTCERTEAGNYNTQLIFDNTGAFVAYYRKTHPFFTSCFLTPPTPMLVTVLYCRSCALVLYRFRARVECLVVCVCGVCFPCCLFIIDSALDDA